MPKRRRTAAWALPFQRSAGRWARSALKAGTKAVDTALRSAMPPAPRKRSRKSRASGVDGPGWTEGAAAFGAVVRRYRLYRPPTLAAGMPAPLVVMLHGCGQDAAGFAAASRMHKIADRDGFLVLYPEQDRLAHAQRCWHWYDTRLGRAQAEAATILAAVDQVIATAGADPSRVAIAGLSAGAGMAALVAWLAPARFAAVAMHSGVAPGVAQSTATALAAMQGRRRPSVAATDTGASADLAAGDPKRAATDAATAALPPLLVLHGVADSVVRIAAGRDAAGLWAAAVGAKAAAPRTVRRGARHPMQVTDFRRAGRVRVRLCEIDGLGHAWSGGAAGQPHSDPAGPDASRLIWRFATQAFAAG